MERRLPELVFLITGITAAIFYPFLFGTLSLLWRGIGFAGTAAVSGICWLVLKRMGSEAARAALWGLFIHLYYPVAFLLALVLPFSFMGISHLLITVLVLVLIRRLPKWAVERDEFGLGKIDWISALLIAGVSVFSGAALFLWVRLLKPDLGVFLDMMPGFTPLFMLLGGLGFALTNAFVEEIFFRGFSGGALQRPRRWLPGLHMWRRI